jgi:hypothetical protein
MDLAAMARVSATKGEATPGWPASGAWVADGPGERTVEVRFHKPATVRRIRLVFEERAQARTQEFTVVALSHRGERHQQVVRQQFTFSPGGATREVEEYATELVEVSAIQIRIIPDISHGPAAASLAKLQISSD